MGFFILIIGHFSDVAFYGGVGRIEYRAKDWWKAN